MRIVPILKGFPGVSDRGYLGWSSITWVQSGKVNIVIDTGTYGDYPMLREAFLRAGIQPEAVDILVLSHFHFDHVINTRLFPNARILLSRTEADYATSGAADWAIPEGYFPVVEATRRLELVNGNEQIAEGVWLMPTPGHTPGHMSVRVQHDDGRTVVLAADAVKNLAELLTGEVRMAWDPSVSRRTIEMLRQEADVIIPGHDRVLHLIHGQIHAGETLRIRLTTPTGNQPMDGAQLELVVPGDEAGVRDCPFCMPDGGSNS
ncbi:MBL fold metallo-hydrolase [Alicyclobacillus macrosporangiidus]|uniref:MBL fold metallo-hydrolase n=1 Tax=Alicyclobacillus macrosporangiidus TaxID=392015 RepID=UPI00049599C9|nr:MBL fold metallo-hydrolase [Alicyclobacillus macrosporangiidus]